MGAIIIDRCTKHQMQICSLSDHDLTVFIFCQFDE